MHQLNISKASSEMASRVSQCKENGAQFQHPASSKPSMTASKIINLTGVQVPGSSQISGALAKALPC